MSTAVTTYPAPSADTATDRELAVAAATMEYPPWYVTGEHAPTRLARAVTLVRAGRVVPTGNGWVVHGATGVYDVSAEGCSCPAATKGRQPYCYHRIAGELSRRCAARQAPLVPPRAARACPDHLPRKETPMQIVDDPFGTSETLPAVSWKDVPPGTTRTGTIIGPMLMMQQRHYETDALLTWPDGNPRMQVVLPLRLTTGEEQSLWVKKPSKLFAALQEAQRTAGQGPMQLGGTVSVTFTGTEPHSNPRLNAFKCFTATYVPPATVSAFDLDVDDDDPAPPAQTPKTQDADDIPF